MNCNDIRPLLEALADGELDLVRQIELEAHLRTCPGCALQAKAIGERNRALRDAMPRFNAPAQFRDRIRAVLHAERAPVTPERFRPRANPWTFWSLGGVAASLACALLIGYAWGNTRDRANHLEDEAINDHVRSLQAGHLMDVVSTDQHTVKPWFIGKLDFSPPVFDLADSGYPLAGGRLERIDGRPAAALVFHRRLHSINLFIWTSDKGAVAERHGGNQGYNTESWSRGGLNFLAVSEIPSTELDQFSTAFRSRAN
ncbi:MAG TPA: anti-sigma factor [Opitutaceae bacterium]